ncbi:MAG: NusG domain II-containing protein [Eubacteriales bacterium]|nr:NusG domain II-containing protein [Eubacteriales bacterium]
MKRKDLILFAVLLLLAGVSFIISRMMPEKSDARLEITIDGESYGSYSLGDDQTIKIGSTNVCRIENGVVTMTEADCPDHICVKTKPIDRKGGSIVCLPNRVVLKIIGTNASDEEPEVIAG